MLAKHVFGLLVVTFGVFPINASYKIIYKGPGDYTYETDAIRKQIGECVTLSALKNFPSDGSETIRWKKDTQLIPKNDRITISPDQTSLYISALEPSDYAYYEARIENKYSKVVETTDFWLHVRGCGKHEKELESSKSCEARCQEKCPLEWTYVTGTDSKCCQHFSSEQTWGKASENCQALGGELTTITNEAENKFISSMLETATGAWIGLNDRESESRYMWNFQQSATQTFLPWGKGEPSNYNENCNIENCVAIKSSGKWNDVICGSFYPYVCQVSRSSYNESDISVWTCSGSLCYKMFNDPLVWRDAYARCKAIHNSGNLVAITSISINNIVTGLVKENAWTGLNDIREAGQYIWEGTSESLSYTNWGYGEPNDMFIRDRLMTCPGEDCIQIKTFGGNVTWHDLGCDTMLPYICERVRDRAFGTGAYVAMVIGSFLFVLMILGIIHAGYQKRQRTAVKDIIKAAYQQDIKIRETDKKTREKISFRSAAKMAVPRINAFNNLK